jgi:hypothetical protein
MGRGPNDKQGESEMAMNRLLDVVVSFAVLALTFTVAGATAVLGA